MGERGLSPQGIIPKRCYQENEDCEPALAKTMVCLGLTQSKEECGWSSNKIQHKLVIVEAG